MTVFVFVTDFVRFAFDCGNIVELFFMVILWSCFFVEVVFVIP